MSKQVLSKEQMNHLKKLGFNTKKETLLLQDILELIPYHAQEISITRNDMSGGIYEVKYIDGIPTKTLFEAKSKNLIDAAYEVLVWCIENGWVEQIKNRELWIY